MSPAHRARQHRWRVLAFVTAVLVGIAVVVGTHSTTAPRATAHPAALVSASDAESSAWYCAGQGTPASGDPGLLVLTNTTARSVSGVITTVTDTGSAVRTAVAIPARSAVSPALSPPSSGTWAAEIVTLAGGGVAVSQAIHDSAGAWSQAPCQSTTSANWYFASGTTAPGAALAVTLLNPTSTPVVVDLSFVTPSGVVHPINYQGIVLQPGQLVVKDVAAEVQAESTVSTEVSARTGRFVASETQVFPAPTGGLSVMAGVSDAQRHWVIPQAQETQGGSSEIDVFNPGTTAESVIVHLRLPSGPLAPLSGSIAPAGTWVIPTSGETRIPAGASYSVEIDATGGPGVVVGRTVHAPPAAPVPLSGMAEAVDGLSTASPTGRWVVAPPGTSTAQPVGGAAPRYLALTNVSDHDVTYGADAVSPSGARPLASGTLAAHATVVVSGSALAVAGLDQIIVRADGPMAVSEDAAPSGAVGVVIMPGLALSAAAGGA